MTDDIAVIGLSCRFPGAVDAEAFWANVRDGVESVRFFDADELAVDGVDPSLLARPDYVAAGGVLGEVDLFDASFFGYTPREAELLDPQQRLFLEHAWWALEDAGYKPGAEGGPTGVFAGCAMSTYLPLLYQNQRLVDSAGYLQLLISNDKDYLATRTSYKLNLTGPSMVVQTACSTGLVAILAAVRSLVAGECAMALAGASTVRVPERSGYFHAPGGIHSPDGHCRPFDASANGTVFGNGVGVVVLKRLADALRDHDPIRAVVRGGAVNNDGNAKIGFTAPSLGGQTAVIRAAHTSAGVPPQTIDYVEAHGTGTHLGDPIEIEALTAAFASTAARPRSCAIGAVKANIGHLDPTAGVAGFIKTVLALEHATLPPATNYAEANPEIDFASTPFYVNTEARPWSGSPRRAAVSAFGIGGTNAHVVLEEAPCRPPAAGHAGFQVLPLSARTEAAVDEAAAQLARHLEGHADVSLSAVAHTLQRGRHAFAQRRSVVAETAEEAIEALRQPGPSRRATPRPVVFLFPGQGAQHLGMARSVLRTEPVFATAWSECLHLVRDHGGPDLAAALESGDGDAENRLAQTSITQPVLFAVEYALARLWQSWGVTPAALLGHSVGEYVAAVLAGIMRLPDAVAIVTERGRLMQAQPAGAMLAVPLTEADVLPMLAPTMSIAAVNEASSCVVAGPFGAVDELQVTLGAGGVSCQRLRTSHAFHSPMMDGVLAPLTRLIETFDLTEPVTPTISNLTGGWTEPAQARDPRYWARQLRSTVRYADGVSTLLEEFPEGCLLLEVGPGQTLTGLTRRHPQRQPAHQVVPSLPHPQSGRDDHGTLLAALGQVWSEGVEVTWPMQPGQRRVSLPGYPFQRRSFWGPEDGAPRAVPSPVTLAPAAPRDLAEWFYLPGWEEQAGGVSPSPGERWLIAGTGGATASALARRLVSAGCQVQDATTTLADEQRPEVWTEVCRRHSPRHVVLLALPSATAPTAGTWAERFRREQQQGLLAVVELARSLAQAALPGEVDVLVVTTGTQAVEPGDDVSPERAMLEAACITVTQEYPSLRFRLLDLASLDAAESAAEVIVAEASGGAGAVVARRQGRRLVRRYRPAPLPPAPPQSTAVAEGDVVLVTGGLGHIGLALATSLARQARIRLLLLGRGALPPRDLWPTLRDDPVVGRQIRGVEGIEATGCSCEVVTADVGDLPDTERALREVQRRCGRIDVVVHTAGSVAADAFFGVPEVSWTRSERVWRAKVSGLVHLHCALREAPPRLWVLASSLSSVLGGLGFTAYAAGNVFLDAYAARQDSPGSRWVSIDWDAWGTGTAGDDSGMTPEQGAETLRRIVAAPTGPRVVVATSDLGRRLEDWVGDRDGGAAGRPGELPSAGAQPQDTAQVQAVIADIWAELLGGEAPQPSDDFFNDLGGHSLLATQVASRLRAHFGIDLSLRAFLDAPTLSSLAAAVWALLEAKEPVREASAPRPATIPRLDRAAHAVKRRSGATSPGSTAVLDKEVP